MMIKVIADLLREIFASLCRHWRGVACYVAGVVTVVLIVLPCGSKTPKYDMQSKPKIVYETLPPPKPIHDTIPVLKYVRHNIHDTIVQNQLDTTQNIVVQVADSETCLAGKYNAPDSAQIEWSACSIDLPLTIREPINWDVKYLPAPRIEKIVTITDTIASFPSLWSRIKNNSAYVAIGCVVGAGTTMYFMSR